MKELKPLDKLMEIFLDLASKNNISDNEVNTNWSIDYKSNLSSDFSKDLDRLMIELKLFDNAMARNDQIVAIFALINSRAITIDLSNFFSKITEDIERIGWTNEIKWPEIPENFQVPEHYYYPHK